MTGLRFPDMSHPDTLPSRYSQVMSSKAMFFMQQLVRNVLRAFLVDFPNVDGGTSPFYVALTVTHGPEEKTVSRQVHGGAIVRRSEASLLVRFRRR